MNKRALAIVVVVILVALGGLQFYRGTSKNMEEAQSVADQFYSCLMSNDLETASTLYHSSLLETSSVENITSVIKLIDTKLGKVTEYKLVNINVKSFKGTSDSYIRANIVYSVTRTRYSSEETMVLMKEKNNQFKISSYNVNSEGFIQ